MTAHDWMSCKMRLSVEFSWRLQSNPDLVGLQAMLVILLFWLFVQMGFSKFRESQIKTVSS